MKEKGKLKHIMAVYGWLDGLAQRLSDWLWPASWSWPARQFLTGMAVGFAFCLPILLVVTVLSS
jgi:hypothetical protein